MRFLFTGVLILSFAPWAFSQTLFDLFKLLPEETAIVDTPTRSEMIANYPVKNTDFSNGLYYIKTADHKNGYMEVDGAMEGSWSMCYWNLGNSQKLVAVLLIGCGPVCHVEDISFYLYDGDTLTNKSQPVIESTGYSDFFDMTEKEFNDMYEKHDIPLGLVMELPRHGKDIIAKIHCEIDGAESDYERHLKPRQKGDQMVFTFNKSGVFSLGKIFWRE